MDRNRWPSLSTLSASFIAMAMAGLLVIAIAAAYAIGYVGAVKRAVLAPESVPSLLISELEMAVGELGYGGALGEARSFIASSEPADLAAFEQSIAAAGARLDRVAALPGGEGYAARGAILGALEVYRDSAARLRASRNIDVAEELTGLYSAYESLERALARAERQAGRERLTAIDRAGRLAIALVAGAIALLIVVSLVAAAVLKLAVRDPIDRLRLSLREASLDPGGRFVWGVTRDDEFGDLARSAERLRVRAVTPGAAAAAADPPQPAEPVGLDGPLAERVEDIASRFAARSPDPSEPAGIAPKSLTATLARIDALAGEVRRLEAATADLAGNGEDHDSLPRPEIEASLVSLLEMIDVLSALADRLGPLDRADASGGGGGEPPAGDEDDGSSSPASAAGR